jgi:hypothetical protein
MEEVQVHISDISHVTPLSENYGVYLQCNYLIFVIQYFVISALTRSYNEETVS